MTLNHWLILLTSQQQETCIRLIFNVMTLSATIMSRTYKKTFSISSSIIITSSTRPKISANISQVSSFPSTIYLNPNSNSLKVSTNLSTQLITSESLTMKTPSKTPLNPIASLKIIKSSFPPIINPPTCLWPLKYIVFYPSDCTQSVWSCASKWYQFQGNHSMVQFCCQFY